MDIAPQELAGELISQLFDCPGDYTITLRKKGNDVEIMAGSKRDFLTLEEVAREFGVSTATVRRRYLQTKLLRRTRHGFRRGDIERLKQG